MKSQSAFQAKTQAKIFLLNWVPGVIPPGVAPPGVAPPGVMPAGVIPLGVMAPAVGVGVPAIGVRSQRDFLFDAWGWE